MPQRRTPTRPQTSGGAILSEPKPNLAAIPRGTFVVLRETQFRPAVGRYDTPREFTTKSFVRVLGNVTDAEGGILVTVERANGQAAQFPLDAIDPVLPLAKEVRP